jgi:shikimate kinase/3-dehydroquinate synthase
VVDPAALGTLPREELAAGYAEVVKTALIAGGQLWSRVRSGADPDEAIVFGCLRTKLAVVAEDERDSGRRQVLNLGHTVGHAIEAATGFKAFSHGEAVGIGLLAALWLSAQCAGLDAAVEEEVRELLRRHELPVTARNVSPAAVIDAMAHDKKARGGRVRFVLLEAIGRPVWGIDVPDELVEKAVARAVALG